MDNTSGQGRLLSLDSYRGFIIVLMVLDHARSLLWPTSDPTGPMATDALLYWTRWITHLCAPGFFLLAGMSLNLRLSRGPDANSGTGKPQATWRASLHLVLRGLLLIVLELLLFSPIWMAENVFLLQVMWAFGVAMLAMAVFIWLPKGFCLTAGILLALTGMPGIAALGDSVIWQLLFGASRMVTLGLEGIGPFGDVSGTYLLYPIAPWLGVMLIGYGLPLFPWRRQLLLRAGSVLLGAFVILRLLPALIALIGQGDWSFDWMAFFRIEKYPPEPLFLTVTLGLTAWLLAAFQIWPIKWLALLGREPLTMYVLHLVMLYGLSALIDFDAVIGIYGVWIGLVALLLPIAALQKRGEFWMRKLRKNLLIGILATMVALSGCAGAGAVASGEGDKAAGLKPEQLVAQIDQEALKAHVTFLSKEDGGRLAGSAGEDEAVAYLSEQFEEMGYTPETLSFPYTGFTVNQLALEITGAELPVTGDLVAHSNVLYYSASTAKEGLQAPLVSVGMGLDADFEGVDVKGKIPVITRGVEPFYMKVQRAARLGASAVLFFDPEGEEPVKATLVEPSEIPAVSVATVIGESLNAALSEGKTLTAKLQVDSQLENNSSENIVATLEAPGEVTQRIIIGAHYDGVDTPAANDNGSGTAAVLELAKILKQYQANLTVDVQFALFGAEESGLYGSIAYVEDMSSSDFKDTLGMINLDMVGIGQGLELGTVNSQEILPLAKTLMSVSGELGLPAKQIEMGRSDHVPFAESGIPAVMLAAGPVDNYHTDEDTVEAMDFSVLATNVEWVLRALVTPGVLEAEGKAVLQ